MDQPTELPRLGKQSRRYTFFLNPYTDARFTNCPKCGGKTKQKKLPLAIHVDEGGLIALNKTCRYYLVVGTLDRPDWKRGVGGTTTIEETIEALHDFKEMVRFEPSPGWVRDEK